MGRARPNTYRRLLMDWLWRYYAKEGMGAPFAAQRALDEMGFPRTHPKHSSVRSWFLGFLAKSRKEFRAVAELFFAEPRYREFVEDGLSKEEVWMKVWETCLEFDWLPLWSDPQDDYLLKPMKGVHYVRLKERRGQAIASEVENTVAAMNYLFRKFPALPRAYHRRQLEKDGIFLALPQEIECDHCGAVFTDQLEFVRHCNDEHAGADLNGAGRSG